MKKVFPGDGIETLLLHSNLLHQPFLMKKVFPGDGIETKLPYEMAILDDDEEGVSWRRD